MAGWPECAGTAATEGCGGGISGGSNHTPAGVGSRGGEEMRNLPVRAKLVGSLLGVGLLTLLMTGWQADRRAEAALRKAAINQLTSIREERRLEIEQYFANVRRDALRLAESREISTAMREFKAAHRVFEAE